MKPPRAALPYDEFHANLPQARLAWLYSRCPIYLCPSWDEGLGMPPMEAMACGAALATYDNGGCRDYARDGETALVAPRRDVDALARALERLVEDAALRERLARAGQAFIRREFDWDRATAQAGGDPPLRLSGARSGASIGYTSRTFCFTVATSSGVTCILWTSAACFPTWASTSSTFSPLATNEQDCPTSAHLNSLLMTDSSLAAQAAMAARRGTTRLPVKTSTRSPRRSNLARREVVEMERFFISRMSRLLPNAKHRPGRPGPLPVVGPIAILWWRNESGSTRRDVP